jgi:TDG/mug DNA glycosylase family protein
VLEGARLWALPNPSGLNAHYQQADLTEHYARVRADLDPGPAPGPRAEP